jgi:hypothetical protein
MNRRILLRTAALGAPLLAAGCAVSTLNGVTTVTVDVATVNSYAQAVETAGRALLAISYIAGPLGTAGVALAETAIAAVASAVQAVDKLSGGKASFSYASTSVPAAITALAADAAQVLAFVGAAVSKAPAGAVTSRVQAVVAALSTVVALIQAFVSSVATAPLPMTGPEAIVTIDAFAAT